jgi:hypothetical protein
VTRACIAAFTDMASTSGHPERLRVLLVVEGPHHHPRATRAAGSGQQGYTRLDPTGKNLECVTQSILSLLRAQEPIMWSRWWWWRLPNDDCMVVWSPRGSMAATSRGKS